MARVTLRPGKPQKLIGIAVCVVAMVVALAVLVVTQWVGRPRSVLSVPELAKAIGRPTVGPVLNLPATELAVMTERLRPTAAMSASSFLHSLHLFGVDLPTPEGMLRDGPAPLLDVLLDVPRAAEVFGGARTLTRTRYGVRVPLNDPGLLGTDQSSSQAHRGQFLSVLGSLGVSPSRLVRLEDGSSLPVSAVRDDLVANFSMEGEIAWDAIALGFYVDRPGWVDKYGRAVTFDKLAGELSVREPGQSSCGGTHDLIALTILVKINEHKPILSDLARNRAIAYLSRRVEQVKSSQLRNGSWGMRWHQGAPARQASDQGRASPPTFEHALIVTGHLMEWLIFLPEPLQPEVDVLKRGATWLASSLNSVTDDPRWVEENYCPLVHATRSLRLLARAAEPPRSN